MGVWVGECAPDVKAVIGMMKKNFTFIIKLNIVEMYLKRDQYDGKVYIYL
jgi:hypothetical protein